MIPQFVAGKQVGVKICGITSFEDAEKCIAAGADSLGFNFWSKSKRHVKREQVENWIGNLSNNVERVGVFVNADETEVISLLEDEVIHVAQLHGDEGQDYCERISQRFRSIKAFGVKDSGSLHDAANNCIDTILLDAYCPNLYGGSGAGFEWALGGKFVKENPQRPVILAGGLNHNNVAEAILSVSPAAVDVASGVESANGTKDNILVKKFIDSVHTC